MDFKKDRNQIPPHHRWIRALSLLSIVTIDLLIFPALGFGLGSWLVKTFNAPSAVWIGTLLLGVIVGFYHIYLFSQKLLANKDQDKTNP